MHLNLVEILHAIGQSPHSLAIALGGMRLSLSLGLASTSHGCLQNKGETTRTGL